MNASYRLINIRPDPFLGTQFTIGAIVSDGQSVWAAPSPHIPGPERLGGVELHTAVEHLVEHLQFVNKADVLPPIFGPLMELSPPIKVPAGAHPAKWVEMLLRGDARPKAASTGQRRPNRATIGYQFFETWGVSDKVKHTFDPEKNAGGWLREFAPALPEISHWVPGHDTVLLMEPVVPTRKSFDRDLKDIATRMMAYRGAMAAANSRTSGHLVAYVAPGGSEERRARARESLHVAVDLVIDTEVASQRQRLLNEIREVSATARLDLYR